jgi:ABC-type transport system involved in multi-copper enzyme maturation permease subunit
MIWLTWRQFRIQAIAGAAILVLILAGVALTWSGLTDLARTSGFTACQANCADIAESFLSQLASTSAAAVYYAGIAAMYLLPTVVGVFWGAPLVARELETGTYRMVWSQTISRRRWLLVKLAGGGLAAALLAGLISLALTLWAAPIDQAYANRIVPIIFAARGVVPVGYALFAFVAGVALGIVLRRTVVAMALTLLVVALAQVASPFLIRPVLAQPVSSTAAADFTHIQTLGINQDNEIHVELAPTVTGAWVLTNRVIDSAGQEFTGPVDLAECGRESGKGPEACEKWLATQNLRQELIYVPGEQFWAVQWREFGLLVALVAGLSWFCLWWIRRRLA